MQEEEDWLFRPVFRGMYRAERLLDCSIDLEFVALCNEAIDVEQENTARLTKK
jgi:hypothetical protein